MEGWAIEQPADPYFDDGVDAWTVSRYADVAAALRESQLIPAAARPSASAAPLDRAVHEEFRAQALSALSPAALQQLEEQIAPMAHFAVAALPAGVPVDLVERYALPWSLQVAGIAARVPADQCEWGSMLARRIFSSACEPYDEALAQSAQKATLELAAAFRGAPPWHMQMFIALAHSLPAFLGNAWLALLEHAGGIPDLPYAIDELLRFAGPAKVQFRRAAGAVTVGGRTIQAGQCVILRLDIANRDSEQFPDPDRLQFDGRACGHLAFGSGAHACIGASLIKSAACVATKALFDRFPIVKLCAATPRDCFAIRYVSSLTVILNF